jgi:manganese transport protein
VVMEGFVHMKVKPWLRRMITRSLAIVPTLFVVAVAGEQGTEKLLILSQVVLSLQLSFAVIPLVKFTGSRAKMGEFVNKRWVQGLAWFTATVIVALNGWLLVQTAIGNS